MDIRFPQPGSDEPDKVTVTGLPDTVDNAIDHLLNLEEEYVSFSLACDLERRERKQTVHNKH